MSECADFQDVEDIIKAAQVADATEQVRTDLATWGGGLVEIKRDRPELMHQTVLEFVMGLDFKKIVLGDLADFVSENGHSFHAKYWALRNNWENLSWSCVKRELAIITNTTEYLYTVADSGVRGIEEIKHLTYHCERAEATTGSSQFDYFNSLSSLQSGSSSKDSGIKAFLFSIVTCGLTLGTREWIARNPRELQRLTSGQSILNFPLLSSTFFVPTLPGFYAGHINIFRLLLEAGFQISADRYFFPLLCAALWGSEYRQGPGSIDQAALLEATALVLQHEQDPNTNFQLESYRGFHNTIGKQFLEASALHICLPALAEQVLRHKGNPNCTDQHGRTALDWLLDFPSYMTKPKAWNSQRRYEMCKILVEAGGSITHYSTKEACLGSLIEFVKDGHDVAVIRAKLGVERWREVWEKASAAGAVKRKRVDSFPS